MKIKVIITLLLVFFSYYKFNENNKIFSISKSNDNTPPKINSTIPKKYEEYIVSRPTIKINYSDESGVDKSSIKLFVNYIDVTKYSKITNNYIEYTPREKFKKGNQIIKLQISDNKKNKAFFEWYFTVGIPNYNHYYGLLHSHTSASDGSGSFSDAYFMAREKANLDFFAITEHSDLLDNNLNCNIDDASKSKKWTNLLENKNWFMSNDKFIPLSGFEMSYRSDKQNPTGHINIYNSKGFVSSNNPHLTLDKFYKLISKKEYLIGQFNHPSKKFGDFDELKYNKSADDIISLLEIYNGYIPNKIIESIDMYQLALDNGWHLAPTSNQDNHRVDFGVANEFRTVILSTKLTEESLFDALKNMRVYATNDKNIKIDYYINNLPMGSTLKNISKLNFYISVFDKDKKDKISKIEVVSNNGTIIKSQKFNSNIAKLEFKLNTNKNKFYYVKVYQDNNKLSVTAPIWIK